MKHLPFLVTKHNTYLSITRDYLPPNFYSHKLIKSVRGVSKFKVPVKKRNSRIIQIGYSTKWATFMTLTFSPNFYWTDYDLIQKYFRSFTKNLRKSLNFKYLAVLEHGGRTGRLHYHILTTIPFDSTIFSYAFHSKRKVCDKWRYGFSDVVAVNNKNCNAVHYLAKYLTKNDKDRTPLGKREVFSSRGLNKVVRYATFSFEKVNEEVKGKRLFATCGKSDIFV